MPEPALDYNLLRVFRVLMEERSVTLAARRLGLTQSSMSNALNRLRSALDDRVLEREGNIMVPTMAAQALWDRIALPLGQLESEIGLHGEFRPLQHTGVFRIAVEDYALEVAGARMAQILQAAAPNAQLAVMPFTQASDAEMLASGEADLAIAADWALPPGLKTQRLFSETFAAVVDAGHPLAGRTPTIDEYVAYPHILVSGRGIVAGNVDAALTPTRRRRHVCLSLPSFSSAPAFLAGSQCILNLGSRLAAVYVDRFGLAPLHIPIRVPGFELAMIWHPRNTNAPMHQWLRARVQESYAPVASASAAMGPPVADG